MAEQNIWASIGQARAEDFQTAKRREEKERRKLMRDQLLYGALLQPVGQAIGQGVTEFINQPFVSKAESLENEQEAIYRKEVSNQNRVTTILDAMNASGNGAEVLATDRGYFRKLELEMTSITKNKNWREDDDALLVYDKKRAEIVAAHQAEIDEMTQYSGKRRDMIPPDKYMALLKKNNPHSRTAIGAALRHIGRVISSPFTDNKPIEQRERDALRRSNPTFYEYYNNTTSQEREDLFKKALGIDAKKYAPLSKDPDKRTKALMASGAERQQMRDAAEKNVRSFFNFNERRTKTNSDGTTVDEAFIHWSIGNGLLTKDNASRFSSPESKDYTYAWEKYEDHRVFEAFDNDSSLNMHINAYITPDSGQGDQQIEDRLAHAQDILDSQKGSLNESSIRSLLGQVEEYIKTGNMYEGDNPSTDFARLMESNLGEILTEYNIPAAMDALLSDGQIVGDVRAAVDAQVLVALDRLSKKSGLSKKEQEDWRETIELRRVAIQKRLNDTLESGLSLHLKALLKDSKNRSLSAPQISAVIPVLLRDMSAWMRENNGDVSSYQRTPELEEILADMIKGTVATEKIVVNEESNGSEEDWTTDQVGAMLLDPAHANVPLAIEAANRSKHIATDYIPDLGVITSTADIDNSGGSRWQVRGAEAESIGPGGQYKLQITLAPESTPSLMEDDKITRERKKFRREMLGARSGASMFDSEKHFKYDLSQFSAKDQEQIGNVLAFAAGRLDKLEEDYAEKTGVEKMSFKDIRSKIEETRGRVNSSSSLRWGSTPEYRNMQEILNQIDIPGFEQHGVRTYDFVMQFKLEPR